jgi:protein-S-isoprenylcysteine O-methyltransferase Ste14
MKFVLFSAGVVISCALLLLILATVFSRHFRIWPTPGSGTWQSYAFWSLFRSLNVLCFAVAIADRGEAFIGLPNPIRIFAGVVLVVSLLLFCYSLVFLGHANSYGAQQGLVTTGIYQWTRNPQNTMLIIAFGALAVAVDSGALFVLVGAIMIVYALMALAEESWLRGRYGAAYDAYCRSVPRFFNWHRAWAMLTSRVARSGSKSGSCPES